MRADLQSQDQRLREQSSRCTEELRALTSLAESTRQWRRSALFSQSVSGTLPTWMDTPQSRTSEDSGLTSDDTNGSRAAPAIEMVAECPPPPLPRPALMSQSTSALSGSVFKRPPRRPNGTPPTGDSLAASTLTNHSTNAATAASSSAESSPSWEERPSSKPVPQPRRCPRPMMGAAFLVNRMERDSLNSCAADDDYAGDEDELFDEINPMDEEEEEECPSPPTVRKTTAERNPRHYADYVNLADFVVIRDLEQAADPQRSSLPQYAALIRTRSGQPELPAHRPFMQWEQRLYRTADKCLSVVEPSVDSASTHSPSPKPPLEVGVLRRKERESGGSASTTPVRRPHLTPPVDCDSGLGRESGHSTGELPPAATPPLGMTKTHAPATASTDDYALPPDAVVASPPPRTSAFAMKPPISSTLPRQISTRDTLLMSGSPLHQPNALRASLVPSQEPVERSGYLTQMSDNRLRSLKRRFVVLKDGRLDFYRAAKNHLRNEPPASSIPLGDVRSIGRVASKSGGRGFQLATAHETLRYSAETDRATDEWVNALNQSLRQLTITELSQRVRPEGELSGWVVRVRNGHQRRVFAALIGQKLLFFKKAEDKLPCAHVLLQGARICEKSRSSSDEYSGSSDEATAPPDGFAQSGGSSSAGSRPASMAPLNQTAADDFSICIEADADAPIYLLLKSSEEREKWLYYLRLSSNDPSMRGSPFEVLIQLLMAESEPLDSPLWEDVLMTRPEPRPLEPLTSIEDEPLRRKAVELGVACHLFASVMMRPVAVHYHADLSQNILGMPFEHECLRNELFALLIRLTSSDLPFVQQAWKLLAMAIPLYLPRHYALHWLLKQHLHRWANLNRETSPIAAFCEQLLQKRQRAGDRCEGPSKLEALSILTRDPSSTTLPFSIPIRLPTGDYQVIEFDGCTEIGQCLSSLCLKLGLRPALLSGYSLYASDPVSEEHPMILLKNKQKLCDCLTAWERRVKDARCGRVTDDSCTIRLHLRLRHYWSHLIAEETPMEKLFLCHRMAEEIVADHLPTSNELAEELCALYAQMIHGDYAQQKPADGMLDRLFERFYPHRLLGVQNARSLRANLRTHWEQLAGVSLAECVRMILAVLRRWRFFGSYVCRAHFKLQPDNQIWIALNDQGIHLLSDKQMDVLRSFPFHRLLNFGEMAGDFMITVSRVLPPNSHPEEAARERLTFSMSRECIEQLTVHLAEFIRCQRLVYKLSAN
ncbi:Pleckstrin-like proteiny domain-containing family H member 1 [Aphelenchoides fujianensis]|nr:Pleckstrin-like proteiny domain-containing family H member 1 [Aphelenchoides fujianensis]